MVSWSGVRCTHEVHTHLISALEWKAVLYSCTWPTEGCLGGWAHCTRTNQIGEMPLIIWILPGPLYMTIWNCCLPGPAAGNIACPLVTTIWRGCLSSCTWPVGEAACPPVPDQLERLPVLLYLTSWRGFLSSCSAGWFPLVNWHSRCWRTRCGTGWMSRWIGRTAKAGKSHSLIRTSSFS